MPIIWRNDYAIGVDDIDQQHRSLFALLEELANAKEGGLDKQQMQAKQENALFQLVDYIKTHFAAEEELMQKFNYPYFDSHKRVHDGFAKKIEIFYSEFQRGEMDILRSVIVFLEEWLKEHILGADQDIGKHIKQCNSANN